MTTRRGRVSLWSRGTGASLAAAGLAAAIVAPLALGGGLPIGLPGTPGEPVTSYPILTASTSPGVVGNLSVDDTGRPVAAFDSSTGTAGALIRLDAVSSMLLDPLSGSTSASEEGFAERVGSDTIGLMPTGFGSVDDDAVLNVLDLVNGKTTNDVIEAASDPGYSAVLGAVQRLLGEHVIVGENAGQGFAGVGQFNGNFIVQETFPVNVERFYDVAVNAADDLFLAAGVTADGRGVVCAGDPNTMALFPTFGPADDGCLTLDLGEVSTELFSIDFGPADDFWAAGTLHDTAADRAYVCKFSPDGDLTPDFGCWIEAYGLSSTAWGLDVVEGLDQATAWGTVAGTIDLDPAANTALLLMAFNESGPDPQTGDGGYVVVADPALDFQPPTLARITSRFAQSAQGSPSRLGQPPGNNQPIVYVAGNANNFSAPFFARFYGAVPGSIFNDGFEHGDRARWSASSP